MPPINPYDLKQLRHQAAITRRILKQYEAGVQVLIPALSTINYKGKPFQLSDYPALQKKVDAMAAKLQNQIYATTVNGIKESWDISNQKNNLLVDKRLAGKKAKRSVKSVLYDPNKAALEAFISRKEKGVDLSQRIWNSVEPFKKEVEQAIGIGIGKGQSAASIAKDIKQYLKEPDKLFRRVRGEDGKLYLSAAARNYNPGQGVYRSSYKNALRVARTETNGSYRSADYERWQKLPFVTGIRIQLSNAHPTRDICDSLVGIYPKDFKFQGWHTQCICFATPEMLSDEEYDKLEADILNGRPITVPSTAVVSKPPENFNQYLRDNKEKLASLKSKPYWMRDNPDYLKVSDQPVNKPKSAAQPIGKQFNQIAPAIQKPVRHALDMIDAVHGDGVLDNIPFKRSTAKNFNAQFSFRSDGKAVSISLTDISIAQEVSIAHEMGHYLDLYSIGKPGRMASTMAGSPSNKVVKKALETKAITQIKELLKAGKVTIDGKTFPLSPKGRSHLRYLMEPEEIWARAYSQYIAVKSESATMRKGISDVITKDKGKGYQHQWDDDDFESIVEAIDEMMQELGWVVNL